jgi:hypothetical protein
VVEPASAVVGLLYRGNATAVETVILTFLGSAFFAVEIARPFSFLP